VFLPNVASPPLPPEAFFAFKVAHLAAGGIFSRTLTIEGFFGELNNYILRLIQPEAGCESVR